MRDFALRATTHMLETISGNDIYEPELTINCTYEMAHTILISSIAPQKTNKTIFIVTPYRYPNRAIGSGTLKKLLAILSNIRLDILI